MKRPASSFCWRRQEEKPVQPIHINWSAERMFDGSGPEDVKTTVSKIEFCCVATLFSNCTQMISTRADQTRLTNVAGWCFQLSRILAEQNKCVESVERVLFCELPSGWPGRCLWYFWWPRPPASLSMLMMQQGQPPRWGLWRLWHYAAMRVFWSKTKSLTEGGHSFSMVLSFIFLFINGNSFFGYLIFLIFLFLRPDLSNPCAVWFLFDHCSSWRGGEAFARNAGAVGFRGHVGRTFETVFIVKTLVLPFVIWKICHELNVENPNPKRRIRPQKCSSKRVLYGTL